MGNGASSAGRAPAGRGPTGGPAAGGWRHWRGLVTKFTSGAVFAALFSVLGSFVLDSHVAYREKLQLQNDAGLALQEELLALTGEIEARLYQLNELARSSDPQDLAAAERSLAEDLQPLVDRWTAERLSYRNRAAQIWGEPVALAIFDRRERVWGFDDCNPLARDDGLRTACGDELQAEADRLHTVRSAAATGDFTGYERLEARGFDAAFFFARNGLQRYLRCRQAPPARPASPPDPRLALRCADPDALRQITAERARLVGVARERVADAILAGQG